MQEVIRVPAGHVTMDELISRTCEGYPMIVIFSPNALGIYLGAENGEMSDVGRRSTITRACKGMERLPSPQRRVKVKGDAGLGSLSKAGM